MIKIGIGLGSRYFTTVRGGTTPLISYPIQLGYNASEYFAACTIGQNTYYSNTVAIGVGSFLYLNSGMSLIAPQGVYSNGSDVYDVNNTGMVFSIIMNGCNP